MSLQTNLFNRTATFLATLPATVTINGTYNITNFEILSASANKANLQYIVPLSATSLITLIEVKDSTGALLSSDVVNIPITSDHLQVQSITVREGV